MALTERVDGCEPVLRQRSAAATATAAGDIEPAELRGADAGAAALHAADADPVADADDADAGSVANAVELGPGLPRTPAGIAAHSAPGDAAADAGNLYFERLGRRVDLLRREAKTQSPRVVVFPEGTPKPRDATSRRSHSSSSSRSFASTE